MVSFWISYHQK